MKKILSILLVVLMLLPLGIAGTVMISADDAAKVLYVKSPSTENSPIKVTSTTHIAETLPQTAYIATVPSPIAEITPFSSIVAILLSEERQSISSVTVVLLGDLVALIV